MHKSAKMLTIAGIIVSLVSALLMTQLYQQHSSVNLMQRITKQSTVLTRLLSTLILPKYSQQFQKWQLQKKIELSNNPQLKLFNSRLRHYLIDSTIFRINIYTSNGTAILSTDTNTLGINIGKENSFVLANSGKPYSKYIEANTSYRGHTNNRHFMVTLIPMNLTPYGKTTAVGVIEVFTDISPEIKSLRDTQNLSYSTTAMMLLSFLLFLLAVARREHSKIQSAAEKTNEYEVQLNYKLAYDTSTGLPNYDQFICHLEETMQSVKHQESLMTVLVIGIGRLDSAYGVLGYDSGEEILKNLAKRLDALLRSSDMVASLRGNEFAVSISAINTIDSLLEIIDSILRTLTQPLYIDEHQLHISVSMGYVIYPFADERSATLMSKANLAMHYVKNKNISAAELFCPSMCKKTKTLYTLENSLRQALDREEFELYYQPVIHLSSGRVHAVEALLRWNSPQFGMVQPLDFIPILEDTGLIIPVGKWILDTACRQCTTWRDNGIPDVVMNVNVSAIQFSKKEILNQVRDAINNSGCAEYLLDLEITESLLIDDFSNTVRILDNINEMGVSLSIDDFGTGYSSLSYLRRMPVTTLKIDRTFIKEIGHTCEDAAIVDAICALSSSLRLKTIAEGVENTEQLTYLQRKGVTAVQGFLFSKPVPAPEVEILLRADSLLENQGLENQGLENQGLENNSNLA